jgi:hypothetical protein
MEVTSKCPLSISRLVLLGKSFQKTFGFFSE